MYSEDNENAGISFKKIALPIIVGIVGGVLVYGGIVLLTRDTKEETLPLVTPIASPTSIQEDNIEESNSNGGNNTSVTPKPSSNGGNNTSSTPKPSSNAGATISFDQSNYTCGKNKNITISGTVCNDDIKSVTASDSKISLLAINHSEINTTSAKCKDFDYAVACKNSGTTTITAKTKSGKTAKTTVKIVDKFIDVKSITFGEVTNRLMKKGDTKKLNVTFNPTDATDKSVEYTSSNTKVLKVDQNGKVTAVGKGRAKITAVTTNYSGDKTIHKDTVELVAYEKDSDVTPNSMIYFHRLSGSCTVGGTKAVKVYVESFGNYNGVISSVQSLDTKIATVEKKTDIRCINNCTYVITGKKAGKTTIEAKSSNGGVAKYTITVY